MARKRVLKTQFSDEDLRNQGRCPLTPEEIGLLLAALGFTNYTRLYLASHKDGMRTLETHVHGLEQALDDISYNLAFSTARMSSAEATRSSCCLLPGSDFLSANFWRRPEGRSSISRFSFSGTTSASASAMHSIADERPGDAVGLENRQFGLRGPDGVLMNPLAEVHGVSRGVSEVSTSRVLRSVRNVA